MLTQEAFDHPPRDVAAALAQRGLPQDRVWLMRHGETRAMVWIMAIMLFLTVLAGVVGMTMASAEGKDAAAQRLRGTTAFVMRYGTALPEKLVSQR